MVEYVVLPGVNDGPEDLQGLARFTSGLTCLVNLLPFNPFPTAPPGGSVDGTCGQLALTT